MNLFAEEEAQNAPKVKLRRYQTEGLAAIRAARDRGIQRGLVVYPTGTGKTTIFSELTRGEIKSDPGATVVILAHRAELLDQAAARVRLQCPGVGVSIQSGESKAKRGDSVVVASVQSVGRPGSNLLDWLCPSLVIVDEAHHAAADTYQNFFRRMGCYDEGGPFLLGVTATDHRMDNLALHGSDKAIFQEVLYRYPLIQAIREGYLTDVKGMRVGVNLNLEGVKTTGGDFNAKQLEERVNTEPINEAAFKAWSEAAADRRTIIFCTGVSHAKNMAEVFTDNGIKASYVHGEMSPAVREKTIEDFRAGRLQVLANCEILTEGFDAPEIGCVLLLRPTQSWSLFCQMVGRGLRPLPGCADGVDDDMLRAARIAGSAKPDCIVIDVVDNTGAHTLTGAPDSKDIPSLQRMAGMPSTLDMEGNSLLAAADIWEQYDDETKAGAFRRRTSFSGLSTVLTQVDLLAELDVPEEAKRESRLQWMKVGDLEYSVNCGPGGGATRRDAHMVGDMLGGWKLILHKSFGGGETSPPEVHELPTDLKEAFHEADRILRGRFPGSEGFAAADARWREGAVTDQQRLLLEKLGLEPDIIARIPTRGAASLMITRLQKRGQN